MVSVELKPCSTTSVEYFSAPLWSVHLRVCSAPSMYTLAPFFRYCSATLQRPSLKTTTRCHSVFSLRSPVALSRQVSDVATLKFAIGRPSWVRRISGSLPRFPTRITLFTLPAIATLHACIAAKGRRCARSFRRGRLGAKILVSADLYACDHVEAGKPPWLSTYS